MGHNPLCPLGLHGCADAIGGRLRLESAIAISEQLELRLGVGATSSYFGFRLEGRASHVIWFSRHVGIALSFGIYKPLGDVGGIASSGNETVDSMHEHQPDFSRETPFDATGGTGSGPQWFGGVGLVTRESPTR